MKTTIYFFSGTGNSLAVAKDISKKLGNCILEPVAKYLDMKNVTVNSERVGFVFPLYYQRVPELLKDFIKKANFHNVEYIFTVITKGVELVGSAIKQMNELLENKNIKLNYGSYVIMPQNCITGLKVPGAKKREKLFRNAKSKINDICNQININKSKYESEPLSFMRIIKNTSFYQKNVIIHEEQFYTDDNCNGCSICENICPVNNIKMNDGKPEWFGNCENCLACMHFCPGESIQYNANTVKFGRYHHPDISMKEIINQKLS